jgi:hypothetical protein
MTRLLWLTLLVGIFGCNKNEAPTGVSRASVEGVWAASLPAVTLLGRSLSGESDWQFNRSTFEIAFFDPPVGQAERISGDWEFHGGKMVMTLRSSFPIAADVGVTDTLFVSLLSNQMSLQTLAGSSILLVKITALVKPLIPEPIWALLPTLLPSLVGT